VQSGLVFFFLLYTIAKLIDKRLDYISRSDSLLHSKLDVEIANIDHFCSSINDKVDSLNSLLSDQFFFTDSTKE